MYNEQRTADREFIDASAGYRYDWTDSEAVSAAVVEAVAEVNGVDQLELDALYDAVDPDALDRIFSAPRRASGRAAKRARFPFAGTVVTVYDTGRLVVRPDGEAPDR